MQNVRVVFNVLFLLLPWYVWIYLFLTFCSENLSNIFDIKVTIRRMVEKLQVKKKTLKKTKRLKKIGR